MDQCYQNEPPFHQCCCTCVHHLADYHHCVRDKALREQRGSCVCHEPKGWICAGFGDENVYHSGWPEHSSGCELHMPRVKQPTTTA